MPRRRDKDILNDAGVVAKFIRLQRKSLGYTQEELALRAGVGLRFLRDLELGKKRPAWTRLTRCSIILDSSLFQDGLARKPNEKRPGLLQTRSRRCHRRA